MNSISSATPSILQQLNTVFQQVKVISKNFEVLSLIWNSSSHKMAALKIALFLVLTLVMKCEGQCEWK